MSLQKAETSLKDLDRSCRDATTAIDDAAEKAIAMLTHVIETDRQKRKTQVSQLRSQKGKKLTACVEKLQVLEFRPQDG